MACQAYVNPSCLFASRDLAGLPQVFYSHAGRPQKGDSYHHARASQPMGNLQLCHLVDGLGDRITNMGCIAPADQDASSDSCNCPANDGELLPAEPRCPHYNLLVGFGLVVLVVLLEIFCPFDFAFRIDCHCILL